MTPDILTLVQQRLGTVSAIVGTLLILVPNVRKGLKDAFLWLRSFGKTHQNQALMIEQNQQLLAGMAAIKGTLDAHEGIFAENSTRLATIEKEMKFNGGRTIKDMLFLNFNYRRYDFRRLSYPALELDGDAQVMLVSDMTCRLFGVTNPEDIKRRSWLSFIDKVPVDDFLSAYQQAVRFQSEFNWVLSIRTGAGEMRGQWELRASPISETNAVNKIYSSVLTPVDELAVRVSKTLS